MGLMDIFKKPPQSGLQEQSQEQLVMHGPPTSKVVAMRKQGLSNNQIIQALQNDGYDSTNIFDALNQADLKGGVEMTPQNVQPSSSPFQGQQEMFGQRPQGLQGMPQQPPMGDMAGMAPDQDMGMDPGMQGMGSAMGGAHGGKPVELERIEELAEAIIDEKWNEIVKSINKIADWKERTESKITKLEQQMDDLKASFEQLHQGILGKIGEYDKNLVNISAEIKAMDKVFQKVLPVMTENVNELSRITQDLKRK
jgi:archaellum component FlaC